MKKIKTPLNKKNISELKCGDEVLLDGIIYTARDQAHKRIAEILKRKQKLPFDLKKQLIYYCGPNPAAPGKVIGACGPTTSSRMDAFTPLLLTKGIAGMIGKGERDLPVIRAIKKNKGVYFITYAGCGALLSRCVKSKRLVCFGELQAEAVYALEVKDFPLIVAIDSKGRNIYDRFSK
ncbi:MAG: FumA C-terminus/TtdB family hydratase beta subunit [Candidatus Omnitrophota bacterium]